MWINATEHWKNIDSKQLGNFGEDGMDLLAELACWRKNQANWTIIVTEFWLFQNVYQHRYEVGNCLTRTSLRYSKYISSL